MGRGDRLRALVAALVQRLRRRRLAPGQVVPVRLARPGTSKASGEPVDEASDLGPSDGPEVAPLFWSPPRAFSQDALGLIEFPGGRRCPRCATSNPDAAAYCGRCAMALLSEIELNAPERWSLRTSGVEFPRGPRCAHCEARSPPGAYFCLRCGVPFGTG